MSGCHSLEASIGMKVVILFLLLFCGSIALVAQDRMFDKFSFGKDLPRNLLVDIEQDDLGRLWIVTLWEGIHLYNGKEFRPFKTLNDTIDNRVLELHRDKTRNMWIVAKSKVYQLNTQGLTLKLDLDTLNFSYEPYFFETDSGMYFYDNHSNNQTAYFFSSDSVYNLKPDFIINAFCGNDSLVHMAVGDSILQVKNSDTTNLPFDMAGPAFSIQQIGHRLYAGTAEKLQVFDLNNFSLLQEFSVNYAFKILEDADGIVWIGNYDGLHLIENGELVEVKYENSSFSLICNIIMDTENNLWIAAQNRGLFTYKRKVKNINTAQYLSDQVITAVLPSSNNVLYWGTFSSGAYSYQNGTIKNSQDLFNRKLGRVYFIKKDTLHNKIWLAANRTIIVLDEQQNVEKTIELPPYWLTNIAFTEKITYISYAQGIYAIDNKTYQVSNIYEEHPKRINDFIMVDEQTMLLSTTQGLHRLRKNDNLWQLDSVLIPDVFGMYICRDIHQTESIFFNTHGSGFYEIDLQKQNVRHYQESDGLMSKYTSSSFINNGKYYLSSNNGINVYELTRQRLTNYELPGEVRGMVVQIIPAEDKGYWIGTTEGIFWLDSFEEEIVRLPKVYVQNLIFDKKPINPVWQPTTNLTIEKDYPPGKIDVHLGLNTLNPDNIYYQTKLEGYEQEWSDPQSSASFTYNNLPPGKYNLLARASNSEATNFGSVTSVSMVLKPYFYQTFWFRLLAIMVVLAITFFIHQLAMLFRLKKTRQQAALLMVAKNEARKEIARNFHDDLGNKIASILYLSQTLDYQSNKTLNRIYENAISLSKGTKDFLWCLNHDNNDHVAILLYLHEFAQQLFADTGIHYELKKEIIDDKAVPFSAKVSLEIIMIMKEAMTNSFRHSGSDWVSFDYKTGITAMAFIWRDNGVGFKDNLPQPNGLKNMKSRAQKAGAKIEFANNEGLEVTLRVPMI